VLKNSVAVTLHYFFNTACADSSVYLFYFQELVQRSIDATERAVGMVNELSLFATNEDVEELATNDLRFHLTILFLLYCTVVVDVEM